MSIPDGDARPTRDELAWMLAELFDELPVDRINEMLAKNVPFETLEFIGAYAEDFADSAGVEAPARAQLPNLLLLGYLIRVVEDRLLGEDSEA